MPPWKKKQQFCKPVLIFKCKLKGADDKLLDFFFRAPKSLEHERVSKVLWEPEKNKKIKNLNIKQNPETS